MTTTSNIHIGLASWIATHVYTTLGTRVNHSNVAYQLTTTGTSGATGPTGTGSSISDGTCVWKWLSAIDYSSLSGWAASIPLPTTQPIVGLLWNDGEITGTVGTPFFTLNNFATNATNTATLKCAAGESFRDTLQGQATALAYSAANGVAIRCPSGNGGTNYFNIANAYFTIDGIQFISPDSASNSGVINLGQNGTITNCLIDGYSQGGADLVANQGGLIANSIFIERGTNTFDATINTFGAATTIINCTFIGLGPAGNTSTYSNSMSSGSSTFKNNIVIGYNGTTTVAVGNNLGATYNIDHCIFSNASNAFMSGNGGVDGGGNLFGKTAANQFVSGTVDFRLKQGADAINAGTTDTTDIPSADDLTKTSRPQGAAWDIGAWEYKVPGGPMSSICD